MSGQKPSYGATGGDGTVGSDSSRRPLVSDGSHQKINQMKGQVDEVKGILKDNLEKVMERGDKVSDLTERTDNLQETAGRFQVTARQVKRNEMWKNRKMWICLIIVIIIVLAVITLIILFSLKVI